MLLFCNRTALDLDAIRAFGVNVKEGEGAIGYFGTGLKYAIAICLRNHHTIAAWIEGNQYTFGLTRKTIRGKPFDFITMNGEQLGFTTELGKSWERWMAFRELYCNMLDEGGRVIEGNSPEDMLGDYETVIEVTGLDDIWQNRSQYFNMQEDPLDSVAGVNIHVGPSHAVFYKGIRALELSRPSKYLYDIQVNMALTEERQLKSGFIVSEMLEQSIIQSTNLNVINSVVKAPEDYWESQMTFPRYKHPSRSFMQVMENARKDYRRTNRNAIALYEEFSKKTLSEQDARKPTKEEDKMLAEAISFLHRAGYPIKENNIYLIDSLGSGIHGTIREDKIFITSDPFRKGLREVVMTLLEEHIHITSGYGDRTRLLQTFLIEEIIEAHANYLQEIL